MKCRKPTVVLASLLCALFSTGYATAHGKDDNSNLSGVGNNLKFDLQSAAGSYVASSNADPRAIAARLVQQNQLAWNLYGKVHESRFDENLVMSPLSIQAAFMLLMPALNPQSAPAGECYRALQLTEPIDQSHEAMKGYLLYLDKVFTKKIENKRNEWALANQVWVDKRFDLNPTYLQTIGSYYNAGVGRLDFRTDDQSREQARLTINRFVEDKTRNMIKDLIPPGIIDAQTVSVLTNSVYMLADWEESFDPRLTSKQPFHLLSGQTVEVDMMHRKGFYHYVEGRDYAAVSLPYANSELAMMVILPKQRADLPRLAQNMSPQRFAEILRLQKMREVKLYLPKFNFKWGSKSLVKALEGLGMKSVFAPAPDNFPRLLFVGGAPWQSETWIQDVVHQAKIIVDEKGTEAAAATAIIIGERASLPRDAVEFRVDHGAMIAIYDKKYGGMLFLGHLANPLQ
jgi:serpin B